MKKLIVILTACAAVACGGDKKAGIKSWETGQAVAMDGADSIVMTFPVAKGGAVADSINDAVARALKSGIAGEENDGLTLAEEMAAVLAEKNADTITAHIPYQMISEGSYYEKDGIYSVYLQAYYFTGGAHGMTIGRYLNFDAKAGCQLSLEDMFMDVRILTGLNREYLAKYLAAMPEEDYEPYLFIDPTEAPLPNNIGLNDKGVVMLYNQYEIAAYVFGQTEHIIPYDVIDNILMKY